MTAGNAPAWRVLMVCTGNVCRSPMAERLARHALAEHALGQHARPAHSAAIGHAQAGYLTPPLGVSVTSAGTRGWEGSPMQPEAELVLAERGVDPAGFQARSLTAAMVASADLVLCATRAHRSEAVTLCPRAVRRCFTMAEFARLTEHLVPTDLLPAAVEPGAQPSYEVGLLLVEAAVRKRACRAGATNPADDDVPDPLGRGIDAFHMCADQVSAAVCRPFELLGRAARRSATPLAQ